MRSKSGNESFFSLLNDISNGRLVPAAFQRDYVWEKDDVLSLCKSVMRGWPVGSVLLWELTLEQRQRVSELGKIRLGPIYGDSGSVESMILDGQNRLATFAWCKHVPGEKRPMAGDLNPAEARTWSSDEVLVCDFDRLETLFVPSEEATAGQRIPLAYLLNNKLFNQHLMARPDVSNDAITYFDKIASAFRDKTMMVTTISRASVEEALEAFTHIARVGQPVRQQDLEKALSWLSEERLAFAGPRL